MDIRHWAEEAISAVRKWQDTFGETSVHPSVDVTDAQFSASFSRFMDRMRDNYPFHHPRYAAQMVKPPHPAAVVGYLAAMLVNPNNHAREGGPATADMELEAVRMLADMFGIGSHLGHLTSSGTLGNLEALYVARESHPGRGIAYSADSHYTHARMCRVLGVEGHSVPTDARGRMDIEALEALLARGTVGTVVMTAGTTGTGAVDPVHEAVAFKERYGVRVHVDAAYGGFFATLGLADGSPLVDPLPWRAISQCDSVVVDPHKHGLQPYGCGAVIFPDAAVRAFYAHDSPYTYFTDAQLHLGEISLECSRPGAAAAALWLTFQCLPPTREGIGAVLAATRRAALDLDRRLANSEALASYQSPDLDIVTFFPRAESGRLSSVDRATARILDDGMRDEHDPLFLSTLRVPANDAIRRHPWLDEDVDAVRVLRSVLLKPEFETGTGALQQRLEELAGAVRNGS
jgi:glutamate/tyrosine decarboxylase-like PLP-dependent enzyme